MRKKFCNDHCVRIMRFHADGKRLYTAQQQPDIPGARYSACGVLIKFYLLCILFIRCDDSAADHIGMPTDIFCCRVQNDVYAKIERILKIRRHECIVDDGDEILSFCNFTYGSEI